MTSYSTHNGESMEKMDIVVKCLELLRPLGAEEATAILNSLRTICKPIKSSENTVSKVND